MVNFVYEVNTNIERVRRADFLYDIGGNRKYVTASERGAFLSVAQMRRAQVRTFCRVLAVTGARISEALALTPLWFDFGSSVIIVECLKKRRRGIYRAIPIPSELLDELDRVHHIRERQ